MVEPVGGNFTPYFNGSNNAGKTTASSYPAVGETVQATHTSGIMGFLTGNQDERSPEQKIENHQGPIGGFFGGMWNSLKGMLKSLCTPEGLLLVGGIIALNFMTCGAITPILFALGVGVGGYQMGKGIVKGDWEMMGAGAFTLGTTFLGAKFDFHNVKNAQTGEKFAMAVSQTPKGGITAPSKATPGMMDNFRLVGGQKMSGTQGGSQNIYQVGWSNMKYRWNNLRGTPSGGAPPASSMNPGTATTNPFTQTPLGKPNGNSS
jgi:hypothetical protein